MLVQVAVAMIVLIAFTGFVADHGLLWVARRQAQNAADAGAHAGASAFAYDADTRAVDGPAKRAAYKLAMSNGIAAEAPSVIDPTTGDHTDITFYSEDNAKFPAECADDSCIRVDVYRNEARANPLPVWFTQLVGVTSQGVRATAIARAVPASYSECLKPWLIPDKWEDNNGNGTFEEGIDVYTKPGWTDADIGTTLTLSPGNPHLAISPSDFFQLTDGTNYPDAIVGCTLMGGIGDEVEVFPGASFGLTIHNVEELIANNDGNPVTVIVGMFDPVEFMMQDRTSGKFNLEIVNMMGFRIEGMDNKALYGTIVGAPGDLKGGYEDTSGNLLKKVMLIR
jgi:Flp pilus assembly protein TadG